MVTPWRVASAAFLVLALAMAAMASECLRL